MQIAWRDYPTNAKHLFKLAVPILISQLAASGMGIADTIMAGMVSVDDMSAISISNSIYFPMFLFILGVLNAITPTVSYLNGAGQRSLIAHQIRQGIWIVLALCVPMIVVLVNSRWIIDFMQMPETLGNLSQQYLWVLAFGAIPALLTVNLRCFNDGLSNPKPTMVITFIGLLLNIPLNYIFIFGKFGVPAFGVVGCGIATVIVNWLMFLMALHYCYTNRSQQDIKLFERWLELPHWATLAKLFKLGLPIAFAICMEVVLFSVVSLVISPLGSQTVASHQIALQTTSFLFMVPLSLGTAITILVGQRLGQKKVQEAKIVSLHAILTCVGLAIFSAILIILFRQQVPFIFTQDLPTAEIASGLLILAAIFQIPDAMQAVSNGILRGYKHTQPIFKITFFCYWVIGMPFGYLLSRTDWLVQPMAAKGFWVMFCVSLSLASGLLYYQIRKVQAVPADQLLQHLDKIK